MTDTESHTTKSPGVNASGDQTQPTHKANQPGSPQPDEAPTSAGTEAPAPAVEAVEPELVVDGEAVAIESELDELVKTTAQRDEYLALAQRTQADFENYRKRVARDAALAQDRGVVKLAKELLPALDNLDRALDGADQEDPLLTGVRLVRSEIGAALARLGIESFTPLGEPFDPNQQEAVAQQPVEDADSGTVAEVYQDGYRMGETIIRPARVLVAA